MRIRTRLILYFCTVTVLITAGMLTAAHIAIDDITRRDLEAARRAVTGVTRANYALSEKILSDYGRRMVQMKAQSVATELSMLLGNSESYDYDRLRKHPTLRAIATENIHAWQTIKGYVDVYDDSGVAVLHPNPRVEGRNFAEWKEEFPDMWKLVARSFQEEEVSGTYCFLDRETNRKRKKFGVMRRVTGTPFHVAATVHIDNHILTEEGKRIVEGEARTVAGAAAARLAGAAPSDYARLRGNADLRRIATKEVYARGQRVVGYVDVYDKKGVAVGHPNRHVEGRNFAEWKDDFPDMWTYVARSFAEPEVKGYYSFFDKQTQKKRKKYMVLRHVPQTPFVVAATVYIDDYFLPVHEEIREADEANMKRARQSIEYASRLTCQKVKATGVVVGIGFLLLGALFGLWFSGTISRPILRLRDGVKQVGEGDFAVKVEEKGLREIAQLARSFNQLGHQLTEYMKNLEKEVAARQAFESEVRIAGEIQKSLLPRTFPPFPDRGEFDLHATLQPAKDVAGDFYDFFFTDDHRLVVIMADVSGKGIPAALLMTASRTLLRNICFRQPDPARALEEANNLLCQENEMSMFVTVFLGYYDVRSGDLTYASAGHNDAILLKPGGAAETFGKERGTPLGVVPEMSYPKGRRAVAPGEIVVLYTDGVTEAQAPNQELFGEERFLAYLQANAASPIMQMVDDLMPVLDRFQRGQQFDDTTLLMLRRNA